MGRQPGGPISRDQESTLRAEEGGLLNKDYRRIDNRYTAGYMLCTGSLNLHFDGNDILVAIEGSVNAGLCYQGFALAGRPFNEVLTYLKGFDPKIKAHRDGATSYQLGIGLYVPTIKKSRKEPVQGVIVFRKGYMETARRTPDPEK